MVNKAIIGLAIAACLISGCKLFTPSFANVSPPELSDAFVKGSAPFQITYMSERQFKQQKREHAYTEPIIPVAITETVNVLADIALGDTSKIMDESAEMAELKIPNYPPKSVKSSRSLDGKTVTTVTKEWVAHRSLKKDNSEILETFHDLLQTRLQTHQVQIADSFIYIPRHETYLSVPKKPAMSNRRIIIRFTKLRRARRHKIFSSLRLQSFKASVQILDGAEGTWYNFKGRNMEKVMEKIALKLAEERK